MKNCKKSEANCILTVIFAVNGMFPCFVCAGNDNAQQSLIAETAEILLSGSDWKLGSFEMGKGEQQNAHLPSFDDSGFRIVHVPGEVQVQLGFTGMDLFYQNRELTFVNEKEWWYRKTFVPPTDYKDKNVRILFDGVDYFASVWLNGEKLGEHEGCFVPFSFDVGSKLRYGKENCLVVKVSCPWVPKEGRGFLEYMKGDWALTFDAGTEFLQFPFPPYRLGPYFTETIACGNAAFSMGLFRDVRLATSGTIIVEDLFVQTKKLNPDGSADLAVSGTIVNRGDQNAKIKLELKISPENFEGRQIELPSQSLNVQPGENKIIAHTTVKDARLWWTWDMGDQNLYTITANISSSSAVESDSRSVIFGIRTVERKSDMSYWLNGKRVFLKGAFFPSGSYFLSTAKRSDYEKDLELFKAANLNHLIVFTIVENEDFFDLCDRLGILGFFEFPFSQFGPMEVLHPEGPDVAWRDFYVLSLPAPHPRREIYIEESLRQIRKIIIQHRNHPSIVLWAPFAEVGENGYEDYTGYIRKIVEELSPGTIFHPSFCDAGEKHFWNGATFPLEYFGGYQNQFDANAGFVSEYGSIALPAYETLSKMLTPEQMWSRKNMQFTNVLDVLVDIPAYSYYFTWEYSGLRSTFSKIRDFVDQRPRTLQELIDDSQLYQAFIFKYSTESFRRKKYNSINGTRIWSYREFTPGIRFSFVDYFNVPKMGYYYLKNAQQRFAINFAYKEALESQPAGKKLNIPVWIINDYGKKIPVDVRCEIFDLKGQRIFSQDFAAAVDNDIAREIGAVEWSTPAKSGVYILRGTATEQGTASLTARDTTFIKVVFSDQPNVPAKTITPAKELLSPLRILLIGQKKYSDPIAEWLTSMDIKADVIKEETIDKFSELRDAEAIQKKYDIVWLTSFASLWKLMDDEMAENLAAAIENGVGFIHTGGVGSFHGGSGYGALIEARALAKTLPVKIHNRNDVIYNWFVDLNDIKLTVSKAKGWPDNLKQVGLPGFNEVELNPDSHQIMTVAGRPLLVSGNYGKGRTVAFMGFTPSEDQKTMPTVYADLFSRMLVEVGPQKIRNAYADLARQYEPAFESSKPLFENLKDLPEASLQLSADVEITSAGRRAKGTLNITNSGAYARLVRMRVQWNKSEGDIPFVMFSDNYFDLLANEKKSVVLDMLLPKEKMGNITGTVIVEGPNIETQQIPLSLHSN